MEAKKNIVSVNLILILVILFGTTNLVKTNAELLEVQPLDIQEPQGNAGNTITPPLVNAADMTPEQRRLRLVELRLNLQTYKDRLQQIETELRNLRAINPQTPEILRLIGIYEGLRDQLIGQIRDTEAEIARLEGMN